MAKGEPSLGNIGKLLLVSMDSLKITL